MRIHSWNRFITHSLAVSSEIMGRSLSFQKNGATIKIQLPNLSDVSNNSDESAKANRGSWSANTGEVFDYHINSVDITVDEQIEMDLPNELLHRNPNAYDILTKEKQNTLNNTSESCKQIAKASFEYWVELLRWVSKFHNICRDLKVDSRSGWSTRLIESQTSKTAWIQSHIFTIKGCAVISKEQWEKVEELANQGANPPIHSILYSDALDCMDNGDYRRALVDMSVSCEVFMRSKVIDSLPHGTSPKVSKLIDEANINQIIHHLFPDILEPESREEYQKNIKKELSSQFDKRNKLMHAAQFTDITPETCQRYAHMLKVLFGLIPDPMLNSFNSIKAGAIIR